jgi:hypothetical protein
LRVSRRSRHSQDGYRSSRFPHHTLLRSVHAATAPPLRPLPLVPAVPLGRRAPTARAGRAARAAATQVSGILSLGLLATDVAKYDALSALRGQFALHYQL